MINDVKNLLVDVPQRSLVLVLLFKKDRVVFVGMLVYDAAVIATLLLVVVVVVLDMGVLQVRAEEETALVFGEEVATACVSYSLEGYRQRFHVQYVFKENILVPSKHNEATVAHFLCCRQLGQRALGDDGIGYVQHF